MSLILITKKKKKIGAFEDITVEDDHVSSQHSSRPEDETYHRLLSHDLTGGMSSNLATI